MILNQEIIDILREIPLGKDNELWIVDAIRQYVERGGSFWPKKWIMENGSLRETH